MSPSSLYLLASNTFGSHLLKAEKAKEKKEYALYLFHAKICEVAASFCDDNFVEMQTSLLLNFKTSPADSEAGGHKHSETITKTKNEK